MLRSQLSENSFRNLAFCRYGPEVEIRRGARNTAHHFEPGGEKRAVKDTTGKAAAMSHMQIAGGQLRAMTIKNIEWSDWSGRRDIGRIGQSVFRDQRSDRLQVWASDDNKAFRFQDTKEFGQRQRNFVRKEMLNIVGRIEGVDTARGHRRHIDHGPDDVRFDIGINVEP